MGNPLKNGLSGEYLSLEIFIFILNWAWGVQHIIYSLLWLIFVSMQVFSEAEELVLNPCYEESLYT